MNYFSPLVAFHTRNFASTQVQFQQTKSACSPNGMLWYTLLLAKNRWKPLREPTVICGENSHFVLMEKKCRRSMKEEDWVQRGVTKRAAGGAGRSRPPLLGKRQPVNNLKPLGAGSHSTARGAEPRRLCFLTLWSTSGRASWSAADCILSAVNIVSVSRSHGALHHLGSQYWRIRCIRRDGGHSCICLWLCGGREEEEGRRGDIILLHSCNVQLGIQGWWCGAFLPLIKENVFLLNAIENGKKTLISRCFLGHRGALREGF